MAGEVLLTVSDLKISFPGRLREIRAVDGLGLSIKRKETVCLVGESGSGKTVSALAMLGLITTPPAKINGQILFGGQELLNLPEQEWQKIRGRHIAIVFQEPMTSLNPVFTIGDQIGEAIAVHEGVGSREIRKRTIDLLSSVSISPADQRLRDYPHQLSGGQRQRVMIAMALACNPELLVADEPTTALDVTVQAQILHLLAELKESRDMSLLYITHDLGVVARIADRICVMYAGILVEEGSAQDIFKRPSHPYTRGLLMSLPDRNRRGRPLYSIPGTVPDPARRPDGCPFHPRCEFALPTCRSTLPHLLSVGDKHRARCPLPYEGKGKV